MSTYRHAIFCISVLTAMVLIGGCSNMTTPQSSGTSSGSSAAGVGNMTGGAEAQPTANPGATAGSSPAGVGNLTSGGSEARPTSDPSATPGAKPEK